MSRDDDFDDRSRHRVEGWAGRCRVFGQGAAASRPSDGFDGQPLDAGSPPYVSVSNRRG